MSNNKNYKDNTVEASKSQGKQRINLYNIRANKYEKILRGLGFYKNRQTLINLFVPRLSRNAKILDIGCGTGLVTEALLKKSSNVEIVGFDSSEEMLKLYHNKFPKIKAILSDFNKPDKLLSFPDKKLMIFEQNTFDFIISAGALSEYGKLNIAIPFVFKLLKKEGVLLNLGIKKNMIGFLIGKIWNFKPKSTDEFMVSCKAAGFSKAEKITIPWKFFPRNIFEYAVMAKK